MTLSAMKHGYSKLGAESAPDTYWTRYSSDSPPIRIRCGQQRIGCGQRKFDRTRVRSTHGCGWDSARVRFGFVLGALWFFGKRNATRYPRPKKPSQLRE